MEEQSNAQYQQEQAASPGPEKLEERLKEGPISLTRRLLETARASDVVSVVYYFSHKFSDFHSILPYLHFETGSFTSRSELPEAHAEVLKRCHEFIIQLGKPVVLSRFLPAFRAAEPELTKQILTEANRMGVYDQYMIPVFGPFDINGVIAFGFAHELSNKGDQTLRELETAAVSHHNRLVRHFGKRTKDVELSTRENDVLTWIARGKSTGEIATILGISKGSVDTYTRRIFDKMDVNSRVKAAVAGVTEGLVKPE